MRIEELLLNHRKNNYTKNPQKLHFEGFKDKDIYNPTQAFSYQNKTLIAARVEKRESEDSRVVFFEKTFNNNYQKVIDLKEFALQDPFLTEINNRYIFGGTEVFFSASNKRIISWRTSFYQGESLTKLKLFFSRPQKMKDVRMVQLNDGKIGVFTRPQGGIYAGGKIGFTIINCFDELTHEVINNAEILPLFNGNEWGGVNQVFKLNETKLAVLGHIAKFSNNNIRHYYALTFVFDYHAFKIEKLKIVAERKDFLKGEYKRPDLIDVIFSGGLTRINEDYDLYVGTSDAEVQKITIKDPFK